MIAPLPAPFPRAERHHAIGFNPENAFVRSNARTTAFYTSFLEMVRHGDDNEVSFARLLIGDPANPHLLARLQPSNGSVAWRCRTRKECTAVAAAGFAALIELPMLFPSGSCYQGELKDGVCSSRRLFVHSLCGTGRPWKLWSLMNLGLWFLRDSSGNEINASAGLHPALPCKAPDDVAWHGNLVDY